MQATERGTAGGERRNLMRSVWAGAPRGALPNDLAAIWTRPARVPAVAGHTPPVPWAGGQITAGR